MGGNFESFLELPERDRKDAFEAAAERLGTLPSHAEKDFWICFVLDALYNRLPPEKRSRFLFKGGTSLSKAFDLIKRFSEDIDLVVDRDFLDPGGKFDPTQPGLSNQKRKKRVAELENACGEYIRGRLRHALESLLGKHCRISPEEEDGDAQTLLVEYPTLYQHADIPYVQPRVKIEAGARSALEPDMKASVRPYIAEGLPGNWSLDVNGLRVLKPERTYLEKALILHGAYYGYEDGRPLPGDKNRISRHYYDVAVMTGTQYGEAALSDSSLLAAVREHNMIAFPRAWKKYDEAKPGGVRLEPQSELREAIKKDYEAMQGMIFGEIPEFDWVIEQIRLAEEAINRSPTPAPASALDD